MKLSLYYGLAFAENVKLSNNGRDVCLSKVLVDTGSATTMISTDAAIKLALGPGPNDELVRVRGIGGQWSTFTKKA